MDYEEIKEALVEMHTRLAMAAQHIQHSEPISCALLLGGIKQRLGTIIEAMSEVAQESENDNSNELGRHLIKVIKELYGQKD